MVTKKTFHLILLLLVCVVGYAQKTEKVHGKYSYTVGENESITLMEVKQKCIINAQSEAIKETFKEKIESTTNMVDGNVNGKEVSAFYDEVTLNSSAEWIGDTQEPVISAVYEDGKLTFTAEVWGEAREITQNKVDFEWKTLCNGTTDSYESDKFKPKDRLYIKFKSPVSGYIAIYLLDSSSKRANRMLPYRNNTTGYHEVKAGQEYILFDRDSDPTATPLTISTNDALEMDQIILIFSPNSFTKNNDDNGDRKHLSSQTVENFEQWIKKMRKRDKDMVIDRSKWITIVNENAK